MKESLYKAITDSEQQKLPVCVCAYSDGAKTVPGGRHRDTIAGKCLKREVRRPQRPDNGLKTGNRIDVGTLGQES